jgi:hypothetical protein
MKPRTYIETTIISDLTAGPSRGVVRAGEQKRLFSDTRGSG